MTSYLAWLKKEIPRWAAQPPLPGKPFCNLAFSGMTGGEQAVAAHADFASLAQSPPNGWHQPVSQDGGHLLLRRHIAQLYGAPSPDNVLIVAGSTQANFLVLSALRHLCPSTAKAFVESPGYGPLFEVPRYLGFDLVPIPRLMADDFRLQPIAAQTGDIAILSNPHNPSGMLITPDQITALAPSAATIVVDETFLTPADAHISAARLADDRIITLGSLSKTLGMGFLRAGWIIAQGPLLERLRDLWTIGFNIGSKITEALAAEVLSNLLSHEARCLDLARTNLDLVTQSLDALQSRGLLQWRNPGQGSIAFPKLTLGGKPAIWQLYHTALTHHRLALVPGHWFDPTDPDRTAPDSPTDHECHHHIRIGFGSPTDQVRASLARLTEVIQISTA